jgi:sulfite oxidase
MGPVQSQEYLYYSFQTGKQNAASSNGFSIQAMPVSYVPSITLTRTPF